MCGLIIQCLSLLKVYNIFNNVKNVQPSENVHVGGLIGQYLTFLEGQKFHIQLCIENVHLSGLIGQYISLLGSILRFKESSIFMHI